MKINSLAKLMQAAADRKCVYCPAKKFFMTNRIPAAFLIGMPARTVHTLIENGLYIYKSKHKSK